MAAQRSRLALGWIRFVLPRLAGVACIGYPQIQALVNDIEEACRLRRCDETKP